MNNEPEWVSLKSLLRVLVEMDMWTMDTKYLNIYLDTRYINGDWHCLIKNRKGDKYYSLEELKEERSKMNY